MTSHSSPRCIGDRVTIYPDGLRIDHLGIGTLPDGFIGQRLVLPGDASEGFSMRQLFIKQPEVDDLRHDVYDGRFKVANNTITLMTSEALILTATDRISIYNWEKTQVQPDGTIVLADVLTIRRRILWGRVRRGWRTVSIRVAVPTRR